MPIVATKEKTPRGPNKWEAAYGRLLEARKLAGEILWLQFEPFRLRIAPGRFYRPDWCAQLASGQMCAWELKGFEREAAMVRLAVAAERHPWLTLYLVKRVKGEWVETKVRAA